MDDTKNIPDSSSGSEYDPPTWDIKKESENTWLVSNIDLKDEGYETEKISNDPLGKHWEEHLSDILVGYCLEHSGPPLEVTKILSAQRINYPPDIFGYHMFCKVEAASDGGHPSGYMFSEVNISLLSPTSFVLDVRFCKIVDQSSDEYEHGVCRFCPSFVIHPKEMDTITLGPYPGFNPLAGDVEGAHWLPYSQGHDEFPVKAIPLDRFDPCSGSDSEDEDDDSYKWRREFTTMVGRRLRDAVKMVLTSASDGEFHGVHVVIAGLTNTYSQYVTTHEEYEVQRYESVSTLYGPHTLSAYIQEFQKLAKALIERKPVDPGPPPPDLLSKQISLLTPVVMDVAPLHSKFGDCSTDVPKNATFKKTDMVSVVFWSACPRNDLLTEGTFTLVEMLHGKDTWEPMYDDDDFCLRFKWSRPSKLSTHSRATIEWRIPQAAQPGVYRIRHFGASKGLFGSIHHFEGISSAFVVI